LITLMSGRRGLPLDRGRGWIVRSGASGLAFAAAEAKLQRPVDRDGLIARTRLVDAIAATPERACLILLTAPAGLREDLLGRSGPAAARL
jgi:hypothetical protein